MFNARYARIFVGLNNEEALWLASRHNSTGSFRHEMTFQDEVEHEHCRSNTVVPLNSGLEVDVYECQKLSRILDNCTT